MQKNPKEICTEFPEDAGRKQQTLHYSKLCVTSLLKLVQSHSEPNICVIPPYSEDFVDLSCIMEK